MKVSLKPIIQSSLFLLLIFSISNAGAITPVSTKENIPQIAVGGANCQQTNNYDVLIIGAGLSGLTAAKELRHLGKSVLILEATSRIGGRARAIDLPLKGYKEKIAIDLGGSWLHGIASNPLTGIVDAMGYKRSGTEFDAPYFIHNKRATSLQNQLFVEATELFENAVTEAAAREKGEQALIDTLCAQDEKNCAEITKQILLTSDAAENYLSNDPKYKEVIDLVKANIGPLENGSEFKTASVVDTAEFAAGEDDLLEKSIGSWVTDYGKGLPACLNSPVTQVSYNQKGVTAQLKNGKTYQAKRVLLTVSTGVLNKELIRFVPQLPQWKKDAYQNLPMGNFQKIIMPFKSSVFLSEKNNSWILYKGEIQEQERALAKKYQHSVQNEKERVMAFLIKPFGYPVAIAYFGGDWAQSFESECKSKTSTSGVALACDQIAIATAKRALANMYGKNVLNALDEKSIQVTRWSLEPYTLGAYSYSLPGKWKMRQDLFKPIGIGQDGAGPKRVFFSGEATSQPIYNGSLAGAYTTGLQVARDINESLTE